MGVAMFVMMAISMVMAAKAADEQRKAAAAQAEAAARQAEGEIKELDRQREFVNEKAAADKSERVRESDRMEASMLVGMADMGGAGTANEARLSQEVGYYEGLDIARLEGNRARHQGSLRASQIASKQRALNVGIQMRFKQNAIKYQFLSSAAKTGASAFGGGARSAGTQTTPFGRVTAGDSDFSATDGTF